MEDNDLAPSLVRHDHGVGFFAEQRFLTKPVEERRYGCCKLKRKRVWMGALRPSLLWDNRYLVKSIQAVAGESVDRFFDFT